MKEKITLDISGAKKKIGKLSKIDDGIYKQGVKWGSETEKKVKQNISSSGGIKTRTGKLRRSVGHKVTRKGHKITIAVGSGIPPKQSVIYAKVQEKGSGYLPGGVIRPKTKKYLTVPIGKTKGRAANFPNAFIIKSKKGNLLIVERSGSGIKPLFVLRKSVKIPPTKWLSIPFDQMTPKLFQMMSPAELLKALGGGFK